MAGPIQLDFVTRKNCPLCEEGLRVLDDFVDRGRVALTMRDVDEVPGFEQYDERVPVLLRNGRVIAEGRFGKWRVWLRLVGR